MTDTFSAGLNEGRIQAAVARHLLEIDSVKNVWRHVDELGQVLTFIAQCGHVHSTQVIVKWMSPCTSDEEDNFAMSKRLLGIPADSPYGERYEAWLRSITTRVDLDDFQGTLDASMMQRRETTRFLIVGHKWKGRLADMQALKRTVDGAPVDVFPRGFWTDLAVRSEPYNPRDEQFGTQ